MQFRAKKRKKGYDIKIEGKDQLICRLEYGSIWNADSEFTYNGNTYFIKANNIWMSKFDILKDERDVGDIDYNWRGEIIIRLKNIESFTKHFVLKRKSIFKFDFELVDFLTNHLWSIELEYNWKNWHHDILIKREAGFEEETNQIDEIELMAATVHAVCLHMKNAAAAS